MVKTCCVKNCDIGPKGNVTCFRFPNNRFLRRKWIDAIGLSNKLTGNPAVCIKHFHEDDYDIVRGRPRLKAKVVPTIFSELDKRSRSSRITEDDIISNEIDTEITLKSIRKEMRITKNTVDLTETVKELNNEKSVDLSDDSSTELCYFVNERKRKLQKDRSTNVRRGRKKSKRRDIKLSSDVKTESHNEDSPKLEKKDAKELLTEDATKLKLEGTVDLKNGDTTESQKGVTTESNNESLIDSKNECTTTSINEGTTESKNQGTIESQNGESTESQIVLSADVQNDIGVEVLNDSDRVQNEGSRKYDKEDTQINSEKVEEEKKSSKTKPNGVILAEPKYAKGFQDSFVESTKKSRIAGEELNKDIEDIIVNYQIKQTRPLPVDSPLPLPGEDQGDCELVGEEVLKESDPVFIELAVQGGTGGAGDRDCLMVLESVQVELDPSAFLHHDPEHDPDHDLEQECPETVDLADDDDDRHDDDRRVDPISLLTSSDEDEVIIQEPHIDTVEVSDETDEDDVPLHRLMKRVRKKKKPSPVNNSNNYKYFCTDCQYTATDEKDYNKHAAKHSTIFQVCEICDYTTASRSQFSRHKRKHRDDRKFKCHLCEYRARHNMSLIYHLKSHRALSSARRGFRCDRCGFQSDVKAAVLKHVKLCNSNVKKLSCDKCAYETKRPSDMRRHRARRHQDDEDDDDDEFVP